MTPTPRVRPGVRLGAGAEFDLIRALLGESGEPAEGVLVGPGDDCAILDPAGSPWAVTVDMSVEGVHFRRAWIELQEIGWRAAATAISDLAAVAAQPVALLLSMALTDEDAREGTPALLQRGAAEAAAFVGASIVGGDLVRSPGPLTLDVVALGRVGHPLLREGARAGGELWVTGSLGGAGAAVAAWTAGREPTAAHRRAFARPEPRVKEALWLAQTGHVRALIDLSDGLAGDAGHLAAASGCGVVLFGAHIPVAEGVVDVAGGRAEAVRLALTAGEDYELCFASEEGAIESFRAEFEQRFGLALTLVGRFVDGTGVVLDSGAGAPGLLRGGYSHFGREPA